jgi:hypothetical protein
MPQSGPERPWHQGHRVELAIVQVSQPVARPVITRDARYARCASASKDKTWRRLCEAFPTEAGTKEPRRSQRVEAPLPIPHHRRQS